MSCLNVQYSLPGYTSDLLRHLPLKYSKVTAMRGITFEILWKKNKVMIKKIGKENHSWNNYHIIGNESAWRHEKIHIWLVRR